MIFKRYYNKDAEFAKFFAEKFKISPLVMELILSRVGNDEEKISDYLFPNKIISSFDLKNMQEFCDRIKIAKSLNDKILIFGDYDVDGVSATAIMLKALKKMGIKSSYYLPNRYIDGYGLTKEIIDKIIDEFSPNLIITVDCGISCWQEVEYAKSKGVEIIITDHHDLPEKLPDTLILNAKLPNQKFDFNGLCGAGLAYKIAEALLGEKNAEDLLPIAAIATIADIVPLLSENRRIVHKGLKLAEKFLPLGIKELFKENKVSISNPSSNAISFKIAPKLNASGRMGDASDSLKLFLETDPVKIKKILIKINEHNQKRQIICNKIYDEAIEAIKKLDLKSLRVITLASKKWDQGVLGIVCSRLVERYHRPVFLFSQIGDSLKGSGRSIDDINIHTLLSSLSDILETYGGHSMAAGVTLKRDNYVEFSERVNAFVFNNINENVFIPLKYYDADISLDQIDDKLLKDLKILQPCGCGNPSPKFKISTNEIILKPMKRFPEHAEIIIKDFHLLMFNYTSYSKLLRFSRFKSFIFEFQEGERKGIVQEFDYEMFIKYDENKYINPLKIEQLRFDKNSTSTYSVYQPSSLINFVTAVGTTVFGTAFVAFSTKDYTNFVKNYSNNGVYYYGVCDQTCLGYNSLLLCPDGVEWAKNFSKIIFLSPVIEEGYIAEINKVTNAEILIPSCNKGEIIGISNVILSREHFGKIFSIIKSKQNHKFVDVFDFYEKAIQIKNVKFFDFFVALKVFEELDLLKINNQSLISFEINDKIKRNLTQSKIFSKISLLKNILKD